MSTREPSAPDDSSDALDLTGVPAALRGSILDPGVLGQVVNDLFRALPGGGPSVAGVAFPVAPVSYPITSPPSDVTRLAAPASLPVSAPASLPVSAPASLPVSAPVSWPLRVPFGVPSDTAPDASALPYFLTETRPYAGNTSINTVPGLDPELVPALDVAHRGFDVGSVRRDFPILEERVHGKPLIWLDNAATTQKPHAVLDRLREFYEHENSNIHRAAHTLAARATDAYEGAREKVRRFLGAGSTREIIFVRGTTEGMNLIAKSWGARHLSAGDELILTTLEHHSNIVPWQMLAKERGAKLRVAPVDDDGQILLDDYERLFTSRTKLVSMTHVSNALGTVLPVKAMVEIAHRYGARAIIDGAQSVSHMPVNVADLGCDFYVFSGHKVFGPTGIGVVYGRSDAVEETPPVQGGGTMSVDVTFEKTVYAPVPSRFEAGTGNIADAVGLGAALDYLERLGMHNVAAYEHDLLVYATDALRAVPGLRPIGTAKEKASVLSFVLDGYRSDEVGAALDRDGIAVRAGHHCAQPALRRFGLETSVRPSLALYNTRAEVDQLVRSLQQLTSARNRRG